MPSRRLEYLRALDIDVWQRRELLVAAPDPVVQAREVAREITREVAPQRPAPVARVVPAVEPVRAREVDEVRALAQPLPDVSGLDWDVLSAMVRDCKLCELYKTRTNAVFGVGNRGARWMVIGEAPGADEDRQGEPFVGKAGQLLNSMLRAIGLAREDVFIANILKSRPPGNRDPKSEEVRACVPYLYRQIELVNPRLILCVGRIAAQNLLNTTETIGKLRGRLHQVAGSRPMIVTYHPAYLLRSPAEKRKSWADLVLAMQTFERLGGA